MKAIVVVFLLVAAASAQFWTDLQNATTVVVTQVPTPGSDAAAERVQTVYRIWVPENALTVEIDSGSTNLVDTCDDPEVMVASRGPTCHHAFQDYPYGIIPCENYFEDTSNKTIIPGSIFDFEDMQYGTYWYIGVRKDTSGFDRDNTCTFATTVTITMCPAGTVSIGDTNPPTCVAIHAVNASTTYNLINVTDADAALVYFVDFAEEQNRIEVFIHTTDTSVEASGMTRVGTNYGYARRCYETADGNGFINMTCFGIPAGRFYIGLRTFSSESGVGNITVTPFTCPAGKSGIYCQSNLFPYFTNVTGGTLTASSGRYYNMDVYYLDFNVNDTALFNISMDATAGTGYIVYRKDVYPFVDSYLDAAQGYPGYFYFDSYKSFSSGSPAGLFINPQDSVVGGRHYFAVVNSDLSASLTYTVSAQTGNTATTGISGVATLTSGQAATSSQATTTTGQATTTTGQATTTVHVTTTTGAATTTTTTGTATTAKPTSTAAATTGAPATTGSASMIALPLALIVAAIALLF